MAGARDILGKIGSIKNTQKITKAMEMVAASKMRRAQERMAATRPYSHLVRSIINHLAQGSLEYKHSYLVERAVKKVGFIIVSTDRGLCGGLNSNLFKATLAQIKHWQDQEAAISFCLVGSKASSFFKRFGGEVLAQTSHLGDAPKIAELIGTVKVMLDAYDAGNIDRLFIVHNEFVNTMTQNPVVSQLIPLEVKEQDLKQTYSWDYLYEPDAETLIKTLLTRYIESQVYQGVVENIACEQAARMVAMKSATDNAITLIDEMTLIYNKVRQAAITQEISEIVAGAEAV